MARSHPLFDIDNIHDPSLLLLHVLWDLLIGLGFFSALKIAAEVLQQSNFLLQVFRVVRQGVFQTDVLTICTPSLHIVEVETIWIEDNFSGVVKEDSGGFVAEEVAKSVF